MEENSYIIVYSGGGVDYIKATEQDAIRFFKSKQQFNPQATLWRQVDVISNDNKGGE